MTDWREQSGIQAFVECGKCIEASRRSKLYLGLIDEETLRVWCVACNTRVVDLKLARPVALRCDICGEPLTEGHRH
jgi:hypothetical protein